MSLEQKVAKDLITAIGSIATLPLYTGLLLLGHGCTGSGSSSPNQDKKGVKKVILNKFQSGFRRPKYEINTHGKDLTFYSGFRSS